METDFSTAIILSLCHSLVRSALYATIAVHKPVSKSAKSLCDPGIVMPGITGLSPLSAVRKEGIHAAGHSSTVPLLNGGGRTGVA